MSGLVAAVLFLFGAIFGSFAGAMVWRLKTGRDIAKDRSECEHCHHKLSAPDLIPLVSWLYLRGKCRYCHKPIGWSALLLEIGLGLVFAASYLLWPYPISAPLEIVYFLFWLLACVLLAILFVYDLRWYLLPDKIIWPLAAIGAILFVFRAVINGWSVDQAVWEFALAFIPVSGVYYLLYRVSDGRWVGFGDVKLGIFIGLALGWTGALLTLVLANFIGLLVVLPGLLSGKFSRSSEIPFGPFLIVATLITMLVGQYIIGWYMQLALGDPTILRS